MAKYRDMTAVMVLRQGSNGHCPPPPQFNGVLPPSCIALIFICPSIIAQEQLSQIKDVDG